MRHTLRPLPPSSSTSEPRFHTTACDKSSKSTSTLDRLETICAVLAHLDKVASKTQVPGFGLAVTTARSIVDTLRDAKSNVKGATSLAQRISDILDAVAGYRRMTTGDMKANVDKFFSDLDEINKYLTQIKNRGRFEAVFYAFTGRDVQTLQEYNKRLDVAYELFQVKSDLALHAGHSEQIDISKNILQEVKNLGSQIQSSPLGSSAASTTSTAASPIQTTNDRTRTTPRRSIPPRLNTPNPNSQPIARSTPSPHLSRPKQHSTPPDAGSRQGVRGEDQPIAFKEIITKTSTIRETETNTKTTRESVIRRPVSVLSSR